MAKLQMEQEIRLKAQVFEAVQQMHNRDSLQKTLFQLKQNPVFKHSAYAAIILFKPAVADELPEASLAANISNEPLKLPGIGRKFTPKNAEWLWSSRTDVPWDIGDLQSDARFAAFARDPHARSLVAVALTAEEALGWLVLVRSTTNAFVNNDVRFLQMLAPYLAHSIKNQSQLKQTQDQLARTRRLLDFDQQLMNAAHATAVYQQATDMFLSVGADVCVLAEFVDMAHPDLPVRIAAAGHKNAGLNLSETMVNRIYSISDYPTLGSVLHTQKPLVLDILYDGTKLNANEAALFEQLSVKSAVVQMITTVTGDKPLGYLLIGYTRQRAFSAAHLTFFSMLARQIGRALDYHSQLVHMRERTRQLETGAEISRVTSQILDETEVINRAVTLIKEGFQFYYVGIFLLDEDKKWAYLRAGSGEEGMAQIAAGHKLAVQDEGSMIGWAIAHREARIALDVGRDAVHFDNPYLPKTRSEMALPLVSQNQVLGALTIQSESVAAFSKEDITALQIMADQLANAILNARLYKNVAETSRKLNTLLDINREITSESNLKDLLNTIIANAVSLAQADQGTIFLLKDDNLIPQAVVGGFEEEMLAVRLKVGEGISGTAAKTGESIAELFKDSGGGTQIAGTPDIPEAVVAIPIKTETNIIGVMLIRRIEHVAPFSESDIKLLEGMALQAAIAWQNLSLLTSIEQNFRREQVIRQLVARIHAASGVQNILQTTVTELTKALNAPGGAVRLAPKRQTKPLSPAKLKRQPINGKMPPSANAVPTEKSE